MRNLAIASIAVLLPGALAAAAPAALPGVSDEETDIPSGGIREYHRGKGDVIFVRHRTGRWYRIELNDGCLDNGLTSDSLSFDSRNPGGRIDRFTRVSQPRTGLNCSIESIRRSAAPPQVNSRSPVTLD